jgi:hypothetical protein
MFAVFCSECLSAFGCLFSILFMYVHAFRWLAIDDALWIGRDMRWLRRFIVFAAISVSFLSSFSLSRNLRTVFCVKLLVAQYRSNLEMCLSVCLSLFSLFVCVLSSLLV